MNENTSITARLKNLSGRLNFDARNYTMLFALMLIWIVFGVLTNGIFFSARNLSNLFRQMTVIGFLSTGMVLVIVTGNIDLSVGSVTGFVSVIVAVLQANVFPKLLSGWFPEAMPGTLAVISTVLTVIIAIIVGLLVGVWQGTIIAYLGVPAFIVTLGGMLIFRGGILGVTRVRRLRP